MNSVSNPGVIGALAGAAFGLADYVIMMRVIGRALSRGAAEADPAGRALVQQRLRIIRPAMLLASFVAFPVVGYFAGVALAG